MVTTGLNHLAYLNERIYVTAAVKERVLVYSDR